MPSLIQVIEEPDPPVVPIDKPLISIGRNEASDLCLPGNGVSWEHASIVVNGSEVIILDQGSKNSTYVNGEPVTRRVLKDHDFIRIGEYVFMFEATRPGAAPPTAVTAIGFSPASPGLKGGESAPAIPVAQPELQAKAPVVRAKAQVEIVGRSPVTLQSKLKAQAHAPVDPRRRTTLFRKRHPAARAPILAAPELANDNLAVWSFVCGWLGLVLGVPAIPAIILGICSRDTGPRASTHRTIGMALGYLALVIWILVGCFFFVIKPIMNAEKKGLEKLAPAPAAAKAVPLSTSVGSGTSPATTTPARSGTTPSQPVPKPSPPAKIENPSSEIPPEAPPTADP